MGMGRFRWLPVIVSILILGTFGLTQQASASGFSNTRRVAVDSSGDVFVVEQAGFPHTDGKVSKCDNTLSSCSVIVSGLDFAMYNDFDSSGDVYVVENGPSPAHLGDVKRFSSSSTPPGVPLGISLGLSFAMGVAVDSSGDVFVAGQNTGIIHKCTSDLSTCTNFITSGLSNSLQDLAVDSFDNLYVGDEGADQIIKFGFTAPPLVCSPGEFDSGGICTPCAPGTFQSLAGQTSCDDAPAGTYVPTIGAINTIICPADNYCPAASSTPITCPANGISLEGSTSESDCVLPPPVIPNSSNVANGVEIGDGTVLGENVVVNKDTVIGEQVTVGDNTTIAKDVTVGDNTSIGADTIIAKDVNIADDVTIGDNVSIAKDVTIGSGAIIGNNVTIEKNVTILPGAIVPDGTTIKKNTTFP